MPVPNPTTLELAQAGALIVGVHRRREALLDDLEEFRDLVKPVAALAVIAVLSGCVAIFLVPDAARASTMIGILALAVASVSLVRSLAGEVPVDHRTKYRPDELAALVGYVEATHEGEPRITELGRVAQITYLSWREPTSPSDLQPEHRPLEAS